jgi:hypothetical protein
VLFRKFLKHPAAALHDALPDARIDAVAFQLDTIVAGFIARLGQGLFAGLASGSLDRLGKLHLRPLAVEISEAKCPHPFTAVADHEIEAAAVGMRPRLLGFNLIRVQRHLASLW